MKSPLPDVTTVLVPCSAGDAIVTVTPGMGEALGIRDDTANGAGGIALGRSERGGGQYK